jgi:hypothetical protein
MRNSFWGNEVTTLTTGGTIHVHRNDLVTIIIADDRSSGTSSPTLPVELLYRVKSSTTYSVDVTPVHAQRLADEESWFPSRWEINRKAAIAGGLAEREKHRRVPKKALVARTSFQQMSRLPCYRGTRPR